MTNRQSYRVIQIYNGFELREYLPCSIAEVKVSADYSSVGSLAFSPLFQYISQGNMRSEKIAMTAPVISTKISDQLEDNRWVVSFVMPSGRTVGQLPPPSDQQVSLRQLEAEICVAIGFKGRVNEATIKRKVVELRALAVKESIALTAETRICRFDPPMKPGFMQYNEIVIPTTGF